MPRHVRNFYIEVTTEDGRGEKRRVATGPVGAGGSMHVVLRIREDGRISDQRIELECRPLRNGRLHAEASRFSEDGREESIIVETDP